MTYVQFFPTFFEPKIVSSSPCESTALLYFSHKILDNLYIIIIAYALYKKEKLGKENGSRTDLSGQEKGLKMASTTSASQRLFSQIFNLNNFYQFFFIHLISLIANSHSLSMLLKRQKHSKVM